LLSNNIEFIEWPALSPDLNPIENLWAWVKHNLDLHYEPCNNAEEIEKRIFEIWGKITQSFVFSSAGTILRD
jgi:transposase